MSRFEPNCSRLYVCFLIFQLCTHKDEFDDNDDAIREQQTPARPISFCRSLRDHHAESSNVGRRGGIKQRSSSEKILPVTVTPTRPTPKKLAASDGGKPDEEMVSLFLQLPVMHDDVFESSLPKHRRRLSHQLSPLRRKQLSVRALAARKAAVEDDIAVSPPVSQTPSSAIENNATPTPLLSMLVDKIDGFAQRMQLSQVFTSMVIIPFCSNVAEQVSTILFAYRKKMDLCVGITVGSAIQIAILFLLDGTMLCMAKLICCSGCDRNLSMLVRTVQHQTSGCLII